MSLDLWAWGQPGGANACADAASPRDSLYPRLRSPRFNNLQWAKMSRGGVGEKNLMTNGVAPRRTHQGFKFTATRLFAHEEPNSVIKRCICSINEAAGHESTAKSFSTESNASSTNNDKNPHASFSIGWNKNKLHHFESCATSQSWYSPHRICNNKRRWIW